MSAAFHATSIWDIRSPLLLVNVERGICSARPVRRANERSYNRICFAHFEAVLPVYDVSSAST